MSTDRERIREALEARFGKREEKRLRERSLRSKNS